MIESIKAVKFIKKWYVIVFAIYIGLCVPIFMQFGITLNTVASCCLTLILIAVTITDVMTKQIPNKYVIASIFPCLILLLANVDYKNALSFTLDKIMGFILIGILLLSLALLIPNGIGGGDIKLMAVCGAFLGWKASLLAIVISFILGGSIGAVIALAKPVDKRNLAFGPYLSIGIYVSMLWGEQLLKFIL